MVMSTSLVSREQKSWIATSFLPLKRIPDGQKKKDLNIKEIEKKIINEFQKEFLIILE